MNTISQTYLKKAVIGKKILVDTNIVIYLTDSVKPYERLSQVLFELIEQGRVQAVFSIISVAEVMRGLLRKGMNFEAHQVRDYLLNFPHAFVQGISLDVLSKVGEDDRVNWSKLRTSDSLIIASGLLNEVDLIVSNDRHFKKALPDQLLISLNI